jgi:hypothetical protein
LTLDERPLPARVPAFYGQSLTSVEYLTEHHDINRLLPFLVTAQTEGYDRALQIHYGLSGMGELERRWHQRTVDIPTTAPTRALAMAFSPSRLRGRRLTRQRTRP